MFRICNPVFGVVRMLEAEYRDERWVQMVQHVIPARRTVWAEYTLPQTDH